MELGHQFTARLRASTADPAALEGFGRRKPFLCRCVQSEEPGQRKRRQSHVLLLGEGSDGGCSLSRGSTAHFEAYAC